MSQMLSPSNIRTSIIPQPSRISLPSTGSAMNSQYINSLTSASPVRLSNGQIVSTRPIALPNTSSSMVASRSMSIPSPNLSPSRLSPSRIPSPNLSPSRLSPSRIPSPNLSPSRSVVLPNSARTFVLPVTIPSPSRSVTPARSRSAVLVASPIISSRLSPSRLSNGSDFQVKSYQDAIQQGSVEHELSKHGYVPISKVIVKSDDGFKKTHYIKSLNMKGQKVFVLVDVNGYTTTNNGSHSLVEHSHKSMVPYSMKNGAYGCVYHDASGVAFECATKGISVLIRENDNLTPKEQNFVFSDRLSNAISHHENHEVAEDTITTYPIVRLSEIRVNNDAVVSNTDAVTRRLRNTAYATDLVNLEEVRKSIDNLTTEFERFNSIRSNSASKLTNTLKTLDSWNNSYIASPPVTDELKNRYRSLLLTLTKRNEDIATLLSLMKRVSEKKHEIDALVNELSQLNDFAEQEFEDIENAVTD